MASGALPLETIGITWPQGVPAQIHSTVDDPRRDQEAINSVKQAVEDAGGTVEVFDYPGSGHLFADSSMPDEYQPEEAELMLTRIKDFLDGIDQKLTLEAAERDLAAGEDENEAE